MTVTRTESPKGHSITPTNAGALSSISRRRPWGVSHLRGDETELIDLRTLVPRDTETVVDSVSKTVSLVVVDEDYRSFGVTGEVVARVADEALADREAVERVAVPDVPIPCSRPLENEVVPDAGDIENAVRATQ